MKSATTCPRLRPRSAGADQPGHPPPPGTALGQQPPPHRADERPALFSLPGTPVIYYGDEIGMGDNIYLGDRNGVRTPMQWSGDRNAGFSRADPQALYMPLIVDPEYHHAFVHVEAQQGNRNSLLWFMKRLIALRKRYQAFGRGDLEFLPPSNRKISGLHPQLRGRADSCGCQSFAVRTGRRTRLA